MFDLDQWFDVPHLTPVHHSNVSGGGGASAIEHQWVCIQTGDTTPWHQLLILLHTQRLSSQVLNRKSVTATHTTGFNVFQHCPRILAWEGEGDTGVDFYSCLIPLPNMYSCLSQSHDEGGKKVLSSPNPRRSILSEKEEKFIKNQWLKSN